MRGDFRSRDNSVRVRSIIAHNRKGSDGWDISRVTNSIAFQLSVGLWLNLDTLRRLAPNLLKSERTKKRGVRGKQLNAGWDHAYLLKLLAAQPEVI